MKRKQAAKMLIVNAKIWTPKGFKNGAILIENGKIKKICPPSKKIDRKQTVLNAHGQFVIPGLIDLHVNGANRCDLTQKPLESLPFFSLCMAQRGVTSFLPTLISSPTDQFIPFLNSLTPLLSKSQPGSQPLGLHLEGPFLNRLRSGAHCSEHIEKLTSKKLLNLIQAGQKTIKIMTLAPELDLHFKGLKILQKNRIIAAMGHSDANYEQATQAIQKGYHYATHLFNAMPPWHHRAPGISGAILDHEQVFAELILDGCHISDPVFDMALKLKGLEKSILVSDEWVDFPKKSSYLPHQMKGKGKREKWIYKNRKIIAQKSGTLAGSSCSILESIRRWHQATKRDWTPLISLATINPAKALGLDEKSGSIEQGKQADLVLLNAKLQPLITIIKGNVVYEKG